MDVALTPGLSLTLEGVTVTVGVVSLDSIISPDKETVPVNPPILVSIRVEEAVDPGWMTSWFGTGVTVKSGGRGLDEETAWLPGKASVTALIVSARRTRLDTATEYLGLIKGLNPGYPFDVNHRYKTGRWAAPGTYRGLFI
jgi:hypothetical protein